MSRYQADYPIATMCRVLGVSTSGYYAWEGRQASKRAQADAALIEQIRKCHAASHGTYGAPRIHADLVALGYTVNRKRVARLMRAAGLKGVTRRRFVTTTVRDDTRPAPDLVDRNFTADHPNKLWVADITYLPTWAGFLYLAVVIDVYSRRVVGWSFAATLHAHQSCARCPRHGAATAPATRCHPPLRSRLAIYIDCVWRALPQGWRAAVNGLGR